MTSNLLLPRSSWTAINPRPSTQGEQQSGLDFFQEAPEIEFLRPDKEVFYTHREPRKELNSLLKEQTLHTGWADLNYNYCITSTTVGIYVIRGAINKCSGSDKLRVLLLLGNKEEPTDVLKKNQETFLENSFTNPIPVGNLSPGDRNIHVFDLIEVLIEKDVYKARNDGYYGPLVEHAIKLLQNNLGLNITGVYDQWLREKLSTRDYLLTS